MKEGREGANEQAKKEGIEGLELDGCDAEGVSECSGGSRPSDKGGGGGHPGPEIRGRDGVQKNFFRFFGPQVGLKIGGGGWTPWPLPWIHHWYE